VVKNLVTKSIYFPPPKHNDGWEEDDEIVVNQIAAHDDLTFNHVSGDEEKEGLPLATLPSRQSTHEERARKTLSLIK
jgi:hypothetical protein